MPILSCSPSIRLRQSFEQIAAFDRESFGKFHNVVEGNVPFATFYASDVVPVQSRPFCWYSCE